MNRSRVIVLGLAAVAAIVAAFLVRGLLGGGTERSAAAIAPKPVSTAQVLVAAANVQAGVKITPEMVRWQAWPQSAVDASFITANGSGDLAKVVDGTVARTSLVAGEPLSTTKIVHGDAVGFMAAQLSPGMRAVSIGINVQSGAGGFVLPNDRVDVLLTQPVAGGDHRFGSKTILSDVRVLAVDQTYTQSNDEKVVVGKTATLELTPVQAEAISRAQASGTLSLSLRPLGDNADHADASTGENGVSVIRYGVSRGGTEQTGG